VFSSSWILTVRFGLLTLGAERSFTDFEVEG